MANGLSDRKADKQELMEITQEAYEAASQLLAAAHPKKGSIFVAGCSTSEVAGERIGSFSSPELVSGGKLSFPPTANFPQIKFGIVSILPISTCCILRHVFICTLDQIHIFPYSLIV